jgi:hypothetical protein
VAKELIEHQVALKRNHVHGQRVLSLLIPGCVARATAMERVRHELLARSGIAQQQNRAVGGTDPLDFVSQAGHLARTADRHPMLLSPPTPGLFVERPERMGIDGRKQPGEGIAARGRVRRECARAVPGIDDEVGELATVLERRSAGREEHRNDSVDACGAEPVVDDEALDDSWVLGLGGRAQAGFGEAEELLFIVRGREVNVLYEQGDETPPVLLVPFLQMGIAAGILKRELARKAPSVVPLGAAYEFAEAFRLVIHDQYDGKQVVVSHHASDRQWKSACRPAGT